MSQILLITPPFVQPNTPYPATAYIKGFLSTVGIDCQQADLSLATLIALLSRNGLAELFGCIDPLSTNISPESQLVWNKRKEFMDTIDDVIAFLQGKNRTLAYAICQTNYLPISPQEEEEEMEWAFGVIGFDDRARLFATRYIEQLTRFIQECIDPKFGLSRYAEQMGRYAGSFDELESLLTSPPPLIDQIAHRELLKIIGQTPPKIVVITIPFAGNLYAALRLGDHLRKEFPDTTIVMGGGFVSTELRQISDTRFFNYCDYLLLDDAEETLPPLINYINSNDRTIQLVRCMHLDLSKSKVIYSNDVSALPIAQTDRGTPSYDGLPMQNYLSMIERLNPMHKLWSDGKWIKLTLAHGCYWAKCSFCDCTLDYIGRYQANTAAHLVDQIEQLIEETGERGFHFVDEAAPPALLKGLCEEIIRREVKIVWWGNVRFEKSFTSNLCQLMKKAGCIAVSGGIEVASERILKLINKGVDLKQVAQTTYHFTQSEIMVHAYLMYGFPTQTAQETIDSLEVVRQLFDAELIQSAFWHRFALTAHSPVAQNPQAFNIEIVNTKYKGFARNDLEYIDQTGCAHDDFGNGLRVSLYNYMNGVGFDLPLQDWFEQKIPRTLLPQNYIWKMVNQKKG